MKYKSIIKKINDTDKSKLSKINVTILSNISLEPYFNLLLAKESIEGNLYPYITFISYQEYHKNKIEIEKTDLIIIWLDFEELYPSAFSFNDIYSGRMDEDSADAYSGVSGQ